MGDALVVFSYETLPAEVATQIRETAAAIRRSITTQFDEVISVGKALLAVKATLPHGEFGKWTALEFKWSERSAENYMRAAKTFGENPQRVSHLPLSLVYRLAAPSIPAEARDKVLDAVAAGTAKENEIGLLLSKAMQDRKREIENATKTNQQRAKEKRARELRERELAERQAEREAKEQKAKDNSERIAGLIVERCPDLAQEIFKAVRNDSWALTQALESVLKLENSK